jgi:glucokinase
MALMPRVGGGLVVVATEGGHQDFAPRTDAEIDLLRGLRERYGHVSVERVVSGPGLVAIYRHLRRAGVAPEDPELRDRLERTDPGDAISRAAAAGDPLASAALDLFVGAYGAVAGDLALIAFATGGLYVGGGIAPKVLGRLRHGSFLPAFAAKGRFRDTMERIPVRVITNPATAMLGAARVAARGA